GHLLRGVCSFGRQLDSQQSPLTPSVGFARITFVDDGSHIRPAQFQCFSWHEVLLHQICILSLSLWQMVLRMAGGTRGAPAPRRADRSVHITRSNKCHPPPYEKTSARCSHQIRRAETPTLPCFGHVVGL